MYEIKFYKNKWRVTSGRRILATFRSKVAASKAVESDYLWFNMRAIGHV